MADVPYWQREGDGWRRHIDLNSELTPDAAAKVLAHEIGHALDDLAGPSVVYKATPSGARVPLGTISDLGPKKPLDQVYHDLNDPTWRRGRETPPRLQTKPQDKGYRTAEDVRAEYVAEAIRAYMADPNYLKTVAPRTAAAIRAAVNANPRLNKFIQFNTGGNPFLGAGLLAHVNQKDGSPMSTRGPVTTTESTKNVNPLLQPYLGSVMGEAQRLYQSGAGTNTWQGPTVAQLNPWLSQGMGMVGNTAARMSGGGSTGVGPNFTYGYTPQTGFSSVPSGGYNSGGGFGFNQPPMGGPSMGLGVMPPGYSETSQTGGAERNLTSYAPAVLPGSGPISFEGNTEQGGASKTGVMPGGPPMPAWSPYGGDPNAGVPLPPELGGGGEASAPWQNMLNQIRTNGLSPQMQEQLGYLDPIASGRQGLTTGGLFGNAYGRALGQNQDAYGVLGQVAGQNQTAAGSNLGGIAAGNEAENPFLQQMIEAQNARIANRVNSAMSGAGRYGSGSHTDVLGRSLAEASNPILAQAYEAARGRQLTANQLIDQSRRALDASRTGAAVGLGGMRQGDLGLGLNAAQGLTGVQQGNIANRMNAANSSLEAMGQGANRALGWAGLAPDLNELQYDPANRMLGVGGFLQGRAQSELDAQRRLFEQAQAMPWTQLSRYLGGVQGMLPAFHGTGSTSETRTQDDPFTWQDALGLGVRGASLLFGAPGTTGYLGRMFG